MNETAPVKKIKKIHLLPNIITAFGLSCGLFVIFKMSMTEVGSVDYPELLRITVILMLAGLADLLDGAVARVLKAESDFGSIFDSLADAISFGVAPAVIILKTLSVGPGTQLAFFLTIGAMIFSLSGVLRLVRFNTTSICAKSDTTLALAHKKNFTGLPIPIGAACAISLNMFLISGEFFTHEVNAWILTGAMIFLGYFMISRLKFPSIKTLELRVASFQTVVLTAMLALLIFFGILHYFPLVCVIFAWGYFFAGFILSILRVIAGRRSKTLEDYEPDADDDLEEEEDA
jgi:CDP-diacylglycerol---serine O-phosphatidyltransferase